MRRLTTAAGVAAICVLLALGATAPGVLAQESSGSVTVSAGEGTVDAGGQTLVPIRLSSAPDGLSGYELTATVADDSVATVTGAEYPRSFNATVAPAVSGNSVTLEAADSDEEIQPGDSSILLGYVAVDAESAGATTVDVSVSDMDDESGADVNPATASGSVSVTSSEGPDDDPSSTDGAAGPGDDDEDSSSEETATEGLYTSTPDGTTPTPESDTGTPTEGVSTSTPDGTTPTPDTTTPTPEGDTATPTSTDVSVNTADGVVTPQPDTATPTEESGGAAPPTTTQSSPSEGSLPVAPLLLGAAVLVVAGAAVAIRAVIR